MTCTSADAVTVVVADALLFAVFVSVAVGPTFAVTIIVPACGCPCAMTVNVELAPLASTAPMQLAGVPQMYPAPDALTSAPPLTDNATLGSAGAGPACVIVTV